MSLLPGGRTGNVSLIQYTPICRRSQGFWSISSCLRCLQLRAGPGAGAPECPSRPCCWRRGCSPGQTVQGTVRSSQASQVAKCTDSWVVLSSKWLSACMLPFSQGTLPHVEEWLSFNVRSLFRGFQQVIAGCFGRGLTQCRIG